MLPPAVSQPTGLPTAPEPSTAGLSSFLPSPLDLSSVVLAESTSSVGEGYREGIKNVAAVQGYSQLEELSFADFMEQIRSNAGSNPITRVTFIGSRAERCVVLYADGTRKRLGEGYPRESPTSQETPQWVVARVRELRIPYDFTINLGRYRDRGVDENYMTPGARKQEMLEQQFGRQQTR
ncbi:unnamed protein product [Vitrella brassicaformis CCMP3155]|uniref:Uncharacterized protein n=1 Tax=Vitrella brassicaformis (strain CCMP3155) TaxID=1169540 RepID=A0A0G4GED3_VITBC|nr:unnamed protein product [Vitrella brassicaformis CCMP3155]|eukprot:CEM27486.1 unnamed protein product [Vitrella brassicaformis CCMP3155]